MTLRRFFSLRAMKWEIVHLILIVMAATKPGISQDAECRSEGFAPTGQFLLEDNNFEYLQPNTTSRVGHLVIVPQMRFTCHGYVTGWSALTQFESSERGFDTLNHDITFQLWRPSSTDSSIYTFVGSETIEFVGTSLRDNLILLNGTKYLNFTSAQSSDERLTFQPGDVMGWYIHRTVQSTDIPLKVVYRPSFNTGNPTVRTVDMYVMEIADTRKSNTPPPCELSLSSDKLTIIPSVIPYVTVNYVQTNTTSQAESGAEPLCVRAATTTTGFLDSTTTSATTFARSSSSISKMWIHHVLNIIVVVVVFVVQCQCTV